MVMDHDVRGQPVQDEPQTEISSAAPLKILWRNPLARAVLVLVAAGLVISGYQWIHHRTQSEGSKLGQALGEPCERVGILAAFGGRSNLYRCTSTDSYGYETGRCDIWVDGAAYDVTKQARAVFKLQGQTAPC